MGGWSAAFAATDIRVDFILSTTDADGVAITENRYYYVYRPDNLPKTSRVPLVLMMEATPGGGPASYFHRKADQAGFIVVSCAIPGNSTGDGWNNHNPRITGWDDFDYITAVINRVTAAENGGDAFICGFSKGGHTSLAYACERPDLVRAACSVDESMVLTMNFPSAPIPILMMHGTNDSVVDFAMVRATMDAWRDFDEVADVVPVTTYEAAPLQPGGVTQTTWRGGAGGTQVAFVTIEGGTHRFSLPGAETGYDATDGVWTFFAQFLTSTQAAPKIVAQPVANIQLAGQPASFWVAATGQGPRAIQWQKNGAVIPGATANFYTAPAVTMADNGATFRAVVTNANGSATSPAAMLTVRAAPTDPAITASPADLTVTAGRPFSFAATATGTAPLRYQWRRNGLAITGATSATWAQPSALPDDSGASFSVAVTNALNTTVVSPAATLAVLPVSGAPVILRSPERVRVLVGQTGPFQVEAWSPKPVSYQWQKVTDTTGYTNIAGATSATYTPPATTLADNGTLVRCAVTNAVGVNNSSTEFLMVATAVAAPTHFTSDLTAYGWPGRPFSYTIGASGGPGKFTYAASPLPAGLTVNAATGEIAGTPTVEGTTRVRMTVSDSAGSSSAWLTLTIKATTTDWGAVRLAALSTRGWVGTGENCLIAGFVLQGDVPKNLLLRAVGPALTRYGVAGVLSDPRLTLIDSRGKTVLTVDDWSPAGTLPAEMQRVGAFALDPGSKDAAVLATVAPGNYTVMVEGVGGATGVALVEIYDVDAAGGGSRLGGLSTRGIAGRDANQMIAGFAIDGAAPRNVLLRAIGGPTLSTFGVAAGLGDPVLEIYNGSGALVARNDDWAKSQQLDALQQAFVATGVFALAGQNKDAALVLTLPPGTYTAKVTNRDQPEGVALIEVYQAP